MDHDYWGRPEQQEAWLQARNSLPRKAYIWTKAMAASDLMGMVRGRRGGKGRAQAAKQGRVASIQVLCC